MNHSYIKAMYNEKTPSQLTEYEKVDKTLNNATDSYNLGFGYLEANQEVTLTLRLWLSDDTPLSSDTMEKTFSSKVTSMSGMFNGCRSLTSLNLSNFDTESVKMMAYMFAGCTSLTSLDLSTFNTSIVLNMEYMLLSCKNLNNITYGVNFIHSSSAKVTNMFSSCPANKPTHSSWNGVTF